MTAIYVDADACPVRAEVIRVADRVGIEVFLVTNGARPLPPDPRAHVHLILVEAGADKADDWIAERATDADICVTADIPLAARVLARGARALAPNGRVWTGDNIANALAGREIGRHLREMGVATGGPPPFGKADRSRFLNALDAAVTAVRRAAARTGGAHP